MRKAIWFLFLFLTFLRISAQDTIQHIVPGRTNSKAQQNKPYLILISADGFRNDLTDFFSLKNLKRLRKQGVTAEYMSPSYPSLTFPNHYSIATGLYPSRHGLVGNNFYDRNTNRKYSMYDRQAVADSSWYGGTPIWSLAEEQHMLSASYFWVGSEAAIKGLRPTYYYVYHKKEDLHDRVLTVIDWLKLPEERRPHFISIYFPEVDHAFHDFPLHSSEVRKAAEQIDRAVWDLVASLDSLGLPLNYIFLSDHGMTRVDPAKAISIPEEIDTTKFVITGSASVVQLYAKNKNDIASTYASLKQDADGYDVFLPDQLPVGWHYRTIDDRFHRIGDIILIPQLPQIFNLGSKPRTDVGEHGFDPGMRDMRATFYAWGPAFKKGLKISGFENVNVFPLMARILGLKYDMQVDGRIEKLKHILK